MSEYTLLDYVQTILSSMDSDAVNSYSDTVESIQVAHVVKTVYNDIQARVDLPEHYTLFELNASGSATQPTLMTRPDDVLSIEWIQYDKILDGDTDPAYTVIKFIPIDQYLKMVDSLSVDDDNVGSFDWTPDNSTDTITFKYRTDIGPTYYTTPDDHTIFFDAYDSDVDTTLQKDKTRCYGRKDQEFTLSDSFVPFLDKDLSTLLLNEAKVLAFEELKQSGHQGAMKWASRGWTKVQKQKRGIDQDQSELDRLPYYGRK